MALSNRLWRAIAGRIPQDDDPANIRTFFRITGEAVGKRHYQRRIALAEYEREVVERVLMTERPDDYLRFLVAHEREHNPEFAL
jgi:hypothetical protein